MISCPAQPHYAFVFTGRESSIEAPLLECWPGYSAERRQLSMTMWFNIDAPAIAQSAAVSATATSSLKAQCLMSLRSVDTGAGLELSLLSTRKSGQFQVVVRSYPSSGEPLELMIHDKRLLSPGVWYFLGVSFRRDSTGMDSIELVLDSIGNVKTEFSFPDLSGPHLQLVIGNRLSGSQQDRVENAFRGQLTSFHLFSKALSTKMFGIRSLGPEACLLNWETDTACDAQGQPTAGLSEGLSLGDGSLGALTKHLVVAYNAARTSENVVLNR